MLLFAVLRFPLEAQDSDVLRFQGSPAVRSLTIHLCFWSLRAGADVFPDLFGKQVKGITETFGDVLCVPIPFRFNR